MDDKSVGIFGDPEGCAQDAAYIVHAANSYPRLVEALRHLEQAYANKHSPQHRDAARNEALSILRSLGESE
jgi:hypothetical protein